MSQVEKLPTDMDLSMTGFRWASQLHQERTGFAPTTLAVNPAQVDIAYMIMREVDSPWTLVVAVPGLPRDGWFVCSLQHVVWSAGS